MTDTNLFYSMTFKYSDINLSLQDSIKYLQNIYNNLKLLENQYKIINYDKLIYIDFYYGENEEIQFYLKKIKKKIADTWIKKQKLINRLSN